MTREEYTKMVWEETVQNGGCLGRTLTLLMLAVVFCMVFSSCATRTVVEYRDRDIVHYVTKIEKDTVTERVRDSVYIHERGDSFFVERWHTRYVDKIITRIDTCWRDSITTEYKERITEVVKYPRTYWYAVGISFLFFCFVGFKIIKFIKIF